MAEQQQQSVTATDDAGAAEQRANDAAAEPTTDPEANGAQDDLDTLLSEYDSQKGEASADGSDDGASTTDDKGVEAAVQRAMEKQRAAEQTREDMGTLIANVRGELDAETFDDTFIEAHLDALARKDPRITSAWSNRRTNPQGWAKVEKKIAEGFQSRFARAVDAQATEDRAALAASVRSATSNSADGAAPSFKDMSNAEFEKYKAGLR